MFPLKYKEGLNYIILFLLTLSLFYLKGIFSFLATEQFAGLDLIGNYAYQWYLHNYLLPSKLTGWSNLWFAGVPVLTFYPPLFFLCTSLLSYLSFGLIGLKLAYKLVIFGSLLCFPLVAYYSVRKLNFNKLESLLISFWVIAFLFLYGKLNAIHQTLNLGLVTQMFGLNLLMIFIGELDKKFWKAGILMSLIVLSHIYVASLAIITIFTFSILNPKKNFEHLLIIIIGFLLSSFWLGPALANLKFVEYFSTRPSPVSDFPFMLFPFLLFSFYRPRKKELLMIIIFLITFLIGTIGTPFKLQHDRFFYYSVLFGSVLAGMGAFKMYTLFKSKVDSPLVNCFLILLLATPILPILTDKIYPQWESNLELRELNNWIKLKQGRILTESNRDFGKDYYTLMVRIPIETGIPVLNALHADSMSSPYTLALQYELSPNGELSPLCRICKKIRKETISKDLILSQLERFNVRYIIATEYGKDFLNQFLDLKKKIGRFYIFEVPIEGKYYEVLKYKPILVVSDLESWKEFSELVFTEEKLQNLTFVWSNKIESDGKFGSIISLKGSNISSDYSKRDNETIEEFVNRIELPFIKNENMGNISNFQFTNDRIEFNINSTEEVPVLLKFSYFPAWDVYLANPSLMLVFAKGHTKITYQY